MKNIKYLMTLIAFLLITFSAEAQLKIGLKGGANFSYITEKGSGKIFDWDALTSYYGGAFVEYELNDRLSVRGEAIYSFEGAEFEDAGGIRKVEINYINLPLLLRLNIIHGIFIDAGIEPGVVVEKNDFYIDKDTELGFILGGGFKMGERWVFNLRYIQGISNVYEIRATDVNGNLIGDVKGRNRLWQIGAEFSIFK